MEEWRLRRGAGARMQDQQLPVLLKGSRYAERLPIGKTEVLQNFKHERLKQFYADWYRPDLMAVVAVGDFDKAAVEAPDQDAFRRRCRARPSRGRVRRLRRARCSRARSTPSLTDKELTDDAASTSTTRCRPRSVRDGRASIASSSSSGCSARCCRRGSARSRRSRTRRSLGASPARGPVRGAGRRTSHRSSALVKDGGVERGARGAARRSRARRAVRLHARPSSIGRSRRSCAARERALAEKDNGQSASAGRRVRPQLPRRRDRCRRWTTKYALIARFVPEITLDGDERLAQGVDPEGNRVVIVSAPEKAGVAVPTRRRSPRSIKAAAGQDRSTRLRGHATAQRVLLETLRSPGTVVKTTSRRRRRHHRVGAVERRQGRAEADDVQAGRDRVPRRSAPAAPRSRATPTSFRPARATQVVTARRPRERSAASTCARC